LFANEGDDTVLAGSGNNIVFGGLGNDVLTAFENRDSLQGNEGNDTISANEGIDTISGGSWNDVFEYGNGGEDGNNAAGGGPVELITDVDFAQDRFDTLVNVTFAANVGTGTAPNLNASASSAIAAARALNGGTGVVAAQFTFGGHTYLAIDQANLGAFEDGDHLMLDITGATGPISGGNFI
jgi:Ca2+-binding RTX toxin-like protein